MAEYAVKTLNDDGSIKGRVTITAPHEDLVKFLTARNPELREAAERYIGTSGLPHPSNLVDVLAVRDLWALALDHYCPDDTEDTQRVRLEQAKCMHDAAPYLWNADLFLTASSIRLPEHTVGRHFPQPLMWFTFDRKLQSFPGLDAPQDAGLECAGVLIAAGSTQAGAWFIRGSMDKETDIYGRKLHFGCRYPNDVNPAWRSLLAAISFMTSPCVQETKRSLMRNERRRLGYGRVDDEPESRIARYLDLRRPQISKVDADEQQRDVEWKCRWLVQCHQRAQWYPSTQSHKIIWIAPYIKGPEGVPLKTNAYRVVR